MSPRSVALLQAGTQFVAVDAHLGAAGGLGRVHGRVGVGQQHVGGIGRRIHGGDADARAQRYRAAVDLVRHGQQVQQGVGQRLGGAFGGVAQYQRELVAAGARAEDGRGLEAAQPLGHVAQQRVALGVAEGVVDFLEAVQVQEQHCQQRALAAQAGGGLRDGAGQRVHELAAVGQAGQVIVRGLVAQLRDLGVHVRHRAAPGRCRHAPERRAPRTRTPAARGSRYGPPAGRWRRRRGRRRGSPSRQVGIAVPDVVAGQFGRRAAAGAPRPGSDSARAIPDRAR